MIWQHLHSEYLARALCLALMHSLWQSILLGVLAGLIFQLTKGSAPARRYGWLVASLFLYALSFFVTLGIELNSRTPPAIGGLLGNCLAYTQDHAQTIVNAWLLAIAIRSLWLLVGLRSLERMKRLRVKSPGPDWEALLARLAGAMGITSMVTLLESGLVKIPLTAGYLKPVILIPMGLLTGLGQQEVEMILVHELAHVLRKDHLINVLQRLVETLFCFNPVIFWLSARIRVERENCADDLVINHTQDRTGYIKALVHYEQYRAAIPTYALAFGGKGTLARMERLISQRNQALHKLELFGLALLLAICIAFAGFSPGHSQTIPTKEKSAFEAKRKAEAEAFGRQQPPQPH
jgi:bla regulator protein blaR1